MSIYRKAFVLLITGAVCLLGFSGRAAGQVAGELPVVVAPMVSSKPVIDGRLDDAVWQRTDPTSLRSNTDIKIANPATQFRMYTDGSWLYVAITAADADAGTLDKQNLGRDNLQWQESLEVFISPEQDAADYYHFAVDPGATGYDTVGRAPATDHDYNWQHAVTVGADHWQAELAIPLADLGLVEGVRRGDAMAVNVTRSTRRGGDKWQAWSPTGGSFHNSEAFGTLYVGSFADAANAKINDLAQELAAALQSPRIADDAKVIEQLRAMGDMVNDLKRHAPDVNSAEAWKQFDAQVRSYSTQMKSAVAGGKALLVWPVNPWHLPASSYVPGPSDATGQAVSLQGFQGEYLTAAVGVANLSSSPMRFRVVPREWASPLSSDRIPGKQYMTVRRVVEVGLRGGSTQRDALPELGIEDVVTILPGSNEVIWVTIMTHDMAPGRWRASLSLIPLIDPSKQASAQLEVQVWPGMMPQGPRPYSGNWARYDAPPSSPTREAAYEDQKAHFTNIHLVNGAGGAGFGSMTFDEQGRPTSEPDFTQLDVAIDEFGEQGQIYLLHFKYTMLPLQLRGGGSTSDAQVQDNFGWYVGKVREHFASRGMGVRDFAWYVEDEPDLEEAHNVAAFGKLMQATDPEQQIYITVYQAQKLEWLKIMAPYVNVWTVKLNVSKEQRDFIFSQNARFFTYSVLSRSGNPYKSYRMEAFKALHYGTEAIGFWSYDDAGGARESSTWIDTEKSIYAAIYEGDRGPVPSVRWEAWRQGIQDFRYVEWLSKLADECKVPALASKAKSLVSDTPLTVLNSGDRTTADKAIQKVRETVLQLIVAKGEISNAQVVKLSRDVPLCITGNDPNYRSADVTGSYTYNVSPGGSAERSGVASGNVYFKARYAPEGTQTQAGRDGVLTDGNTKYSAGWLLFNGAPKDLAITFDLGKVWDLSHGSILADTNRYVPNVRQFTIYLSDTGKDGSWTQIDKIELYEEGGEPSLAAGEGRKRADQSLNIQLANQRARFVRIEMQTPGIVRLGEIRFYGWDAQ